MPALLIVLLAGLGLGVSEPAGRPVVQRLRSLSSLLDTRLSAIDSHNEDLTEPCERTDVMAELERLRSVLDDELNAADEHGLSRVHQSVLEQDVRRLNVLLGCGANLECTAGPYAVRPVHLAVLAGDERTDCLRRLLDAGAQADAPDAKGTTALHAASSLNLPHVCSILLGSGASCECQGPKGVRPLLLAAGSNAAEAADVLLRAGAKVDVTDKKRRTPCHAAAAADGAEALEVLLDFGADAERPDSSGQRPLHYAVRCCRCSSMRCPRMRALQLLLEHGVPPDAEDDAGWTALDVAAEHNRVAAMQMLLHAGADVNGKGSSGCPPLVLAAHAGAREGTALLLAAGAAIDSRDAYGATALQAAAVGAHVSTLKMLLQMGAPTDSVDDAGRSAAHYAARAGSVPSLRALRRAGVDLRSRTSFGWTPLHVAANHSHPGAISTLLQSRCPASVADEVGWTPLHLAAHRLGQGTNGCQCKRCMKLHRRRRQCMQLLLEGGSVTGATDARGNTACHLSAAHDDVEGLRLLRAHRANLWAADHEGQRPLDIARHAHRPSSFVRTLLLIPDCDCDMQDHVQDVQA